MPVTLINIAMHLASKISFSVAFYLHACLEELYLKLQSNGSHIRVGTSRWSMLSKLMAMSKLEFWAQARCRRVSERLLLGFPGSSLRPFAGYIKVDN